MLLGAVTLGYNADAQDARKAGLCVEPGLAGRFRCRAE